MTTPCANEHRVTSTLVLSTERDRSSCMAPGSRPGPYSFSQPNRAGGNVGCMPRRTRRDYEDLAGQWEGFIFDFFRREIEEWVSGEVAVEMLGPSIDSLDALFVMALFAEQLPVFLGLQVAAAYEEGASWNQIAACLRVSRQAATKRFRNFI